MADRQNFHVVLIDLSGNHGLLCVLSKLVPGTVGSGQLGIQFAHRGFQKTLGKVELGQLRQVPLSLASGAVGAVRPQIFQRNDPVGVVTVDRGPELHGNGPGNEHVFGQRICHVPQFGNLIGEGGGGLNKSVRFVGPVPGAGVNGVALQTLPGIEVEWGPLSFRQWPALAAVPLIFPGDVVANGRFVHNAGINAFEPVVIPLQGLVVKNLAVEGTLLMCRSGEQKLFGYVMKQFIKVLATLPMKMIVDGILTGTGIDWNLNPISLVFPQLVGVRAVVGVEQGGPCKAQRIALPLLREQVVKIFVHPVIGIVHGFFPEQLQIFW